MVERWMDGYMMNLWKMAKDGQKQRMYMKAYRRDIASLLARFWVLLPSFYARGMQRTAECL
jgi:hypothetical protein